MPCDSAWFNRSCDWNPLSLVTIVNGLNFVAVFYLLQKDFIVLGLVGGKVTFKASTGNLPLTLQTDKEYNDGKWHFVTVVKNGYR